MFRECQLRKLPASEKAMVSLKSTGESDEEDEDEWDAQALVTTELCCFASDEIVNDH